MKINQQTNEQRVTAPLLRMTCAFPPSTLSRVSQGSKGLKSPRKSKQKREVLRFPAQGRGMEGEQYLGISEQGQLSGKDLGSFSC